MSWTPRVLVLAVVSLPAACGQLEPIDVNVCGNEVVEPGNHEDCDTHSPSPCGEVGTPHQCRFLCQPVVPEGQCPLGYGCGTDGVCRQPKGEFLRYDSIELGFLSRLAAGDFDADGQDDLLTATAASLVVHYSGARGSVDATYAMAPRVGQPMVGQLTDDERADVATLDDWGLDVLQGQSGRTMLSTVYPVLPYPGEWGEDVVRIIPLDVRSASIDPETGALVNAGDELVVAHASAVQRWEVETQSFVPLGQLPLGTERLAGEILVGQLDEDAATSPCEDMVLAYLATDRVVVLSPCAGDAWTSDSTLGHGGRYPAVRIPDGAVREVKLVQANPTVDAHLDLLVIAVHADDVVDPPELSPRSVWLAYGEGDGTFESSVGADDDQAASLPRDPGLDLALLAAEDLNGDDYLDLVVPWGIFLTVPPASGDPYEQADLYLAAQSDYGWDLAAVEDFNGDGWLDVAAASSLGSRIDFLAGGDGWAPTTHLIALQVPARALGVGDFDGNGLPDLAIVEDAIEGVVAKDSALSVCFGELGAPPSAPVRAGQLGDAVHHIATGSFADYNYDDMDDLFAIYERDGTPHVAVLGGSGDRRLGATYPLQADTGDDAEDPDIPLALVLGHFTDAAADDSGRREAAVLTVAWSRSSDVLHFGQRHVWRLALGSNAELSENLPSPPPLGLDGLIATLLTAPLVAPIDLDDDGVDELVLLGSWSEPTQRPELPRGGVLIGRAPPDGSHGHWDFGTAQAPELVSTEEGYCHDPYLPLGCWDEAYALAGASDDGPPPEPPLSWSFLYDGHVEVGDVDGDGLDDLVALAYWHGAVDQGPLPTGIVIWRNEGNGLLGPAQRHPLQVTIDDHEVAYESPLAFTLLQADSDAALEIAVTTLLAGAYWADVNLGEGRLTGVHPVDDGDGGLKLAAGDFDGDGVTDLARAGVEGVTLLRGVPMRP